MSPLSEIRAYLPLSDRLATSGQPTAPQFESIKGAGFEVVVNLALGTSPGALPDEAEIVARHGLAYVHIPIDFKAPDVPSALRFFEVMRAHRERRTFVHCIANYRVSALVYAYRVLEGEMTPARAREDLQKLWIPDATWQRYIEDVLLAGAPLSEEVSRVR
jgi:protein tyrosine phosphatase (PTP) superfamily phosphohydrolase (DUF442 family)